MSIPELTLRHAFELGELGHCVILPVQTGSQGREEGSHLSRIMAECP